MVEREFQEGMWAGSSAVSNDKESLERVIVDRDDVPPSNNFNLGQNMQDLPREWSKAPPLSAQTMPCVTICPPTGENSSHSKQGCLLFSLSLPPFS